MGLSEVRSFQVAGEGSSLYVETMGQAGRPVLLVHGGPGLFGYMRGLAEGLSGQNRVWDYYQRGSRFSPQQTGITVDNHVKDLVAILKKMNDEVGKPILIGHSWGGGLSLLTVARNPGLVEKIVTVGVMAFDLPGIGLFMKNIDDRLTEDEKKVRMANLAAIAMEKDKDKRDMLFAKMSDHIYKTYQFMPPAKPLSEQSRNIDSDCFYQTHADLGAILQKRDITEEFAKITVPVTMIHGEYDPSPGRHVEPLLKARMPQLKSLFVPECGHYPWFESEAVVQKFFATIKPEVV